MVKRCVRVYVEGGATGRPANSDFRRGWKTFLKELHRLAVSSGYQALEIVRGKDRANAFRGFKKHKTDYPNDLCVLLVDAETGVPNGTHVWDVVAKREKDKWKRPEWATESQLYLMVHFVETWLVADTDALRKFFGRDFDPKPLPKTDLEARSKDEILRALKKATRNSSKGSYRHGHAHEIICDVDPEKVKTLSHGRRLFNSLTQLIKAESTSS